MSIRIQTWGETAGTYFNLALIAGHLKNEQLDIDNNSRGVLKKRAPSVFSGHKNTWDDLTAVLMTPNPYEALKTLDSIGALRQLLPELTRCKNTRQNSKYHQDTVYEHCLKVCAATEASVALRWAGLLHDIGKFVVARRDTSGEPTFHKHEVFSARLATSILFNLGAPPELSQHIIDLISQHMYYYTSEWTDKTVLRFLNKLFLSEVNEAAIHDHPLFKLRRADRQSRGFEVATSKQADFEARLLQLHRGSEVHKLLPL